MRLIGGTICLTAVLVASSSHASAQTLVNLGMTVRQIRSETERFTLADIPMFETTVGGGGRRQFYVSLNTGLTWGVQGGHSVDFYFGDTFRWYPAKNVGLFAHGRIGTFLLTNVTARGSAGVDVEIPIGKTSRLVIGPAAKEHRVGHRRRGAIGSDRRICNSVWTE